MKKILIAFLTVLLCLTAVSCASQSNNPNQTGSPTGEESGSLVTAGETAPSIPVNVYTLKGPTGMGMAKLNDSADANQTANRYLFTYASDPTQVQAALLNGDADIAAIPVNMAAALYNKTNGGVKIAAVNTLGVLYMLENGDTIHSVQDLKGKTVYATGQASTPEYILRHILTQNGIDPDNDVEIIYKAEHSELATLMTSGDVVLGMLPEPNVTAVLSGNQNVRIALNLTEEWNKVAENGSQLVQGVLVVRTAFAEAHPEAVTAFLDDYRASVTFTNESPDEAAQLIEKYGIIPKAAVARKALPNCNITFVTGDSMISMVQDMLGVLYQANPKSVGGTLPDETLFFGK